MGSPWTLWSPQVHRVINSVSILWATTTATTTPGTEPHKQARYFVALGWLTLREVPP